MANLIWEHTSVMSNPLKFLLFCLTAVSTDCQILCQKHLVYPVADDRGDLRIMFYNTENFFDTINDPSHIDEEYLPTSQKKWDRARYREKTLHVFKVIAAVGGVQPPEVIGFAEIENRKVLEDIIYKTPLEKFKYNIIHQESEDQRGIDVGVIYRPDKIKCIKYEFIKVIYPWDPKKRTRDIIYFEALANKDTLHMFFNHWPSRMGGQKKSNPSRRLVALILKTKVDSILTINSHARIIITGDFNDQPKNESIAVVLGAAKPDEKISNRKLYNLSWSLKDNCHCGSYRYGAQWNMLDQFIVSGAMLTDTKHASTCLQCVHIGDFDFLLLPDTKYGSYKPFRTYQGPIYKNGYSDHLPVYIDIILH
jgi:predicted extracellular nuclease